VNLKHGLKVRDAGADAVIAVAAGAGGHAGEITPNVLVPWLKEKLGVPIIAAGGIATGGAVAASLALGADAAYVGTRFLASQESAAEDAYKKMCVDCGPEDVVYTPEISGTNGWFFRESVEAFRRGEVSGAWKGVWSAGQNVGLINEVKPAAEIVADLVREYEAVRAGLPALREAETA
jgi:nitronate monooxygenase